jgi:uncharacterized protein YaaN involved in tellurite resistance
MSEEGSTVPVPVGAPPASPEPKLPTAVAESDANELRERARGLLSKLESSPQDRQLARSLGALGDDAQQRAGHEIDLLKTKVGTLLTDLDGPGAQIPQGLMQLRKTMDGINPHVLSGPAKGFLSRLLRRTPVIGDVLADIAVKYETVQTQIDSIIDGLRAGKDQLLQDSLELDRLYQQVQAAQVELQKAAFLGELLWKGLEEQLGPETDRHERQRLETLVHRVAMRVQDLRTMEQVNTQFFVSIDMTVQNNDHLSDAISRTVTVTRSLLTVGLAIQAALANQKKIMEAVKETQDYTADMLAANAASIKQQTAEIGDMYKNPVLALDKVKLAYDDLMGAMDQMDEIRRAGTESARSGIVELDRMTSELSPRADALRSAREFEVPSEASPAEGSPGEGEGQ